MPEPSPPASSVPRPSGSRAFFASPTFKVFLGGFLVLVLLLPLGMVRNLVAERERRHDAVVAEIAALWGSQQLVGGPVLTLPYRVWWETLTSSRSAATEGCTRRWSTSSS